MNKRLVILDRDGVINHDSPNYIRHVDEWVPIDGAIEAIVALHLTGHTVVVATNQAGVAKGAFTAQELDCMHARLLSLVRQAGGQIDRIYDCRHHPDQHCTCRKPQPGMLLQACQDFGQKPENVYFIGDSITDMKAAANAGCRPLLVLTGNGNKTSQSPDFDRDIPTLPALRDLPEWLSKAYTGQFGASEMRAEETKMPFLPENR